MAINSITYNGYNYSIEWSNTERPHVVNWFSNMAMLTAPLRLMGVDYPSVEHAYQAAKFVEPHIREKIRQAPHGGVAKRLGKKYKLSTPDWEKKRVDVMRALNIQKWSREPYKSRLLAFKKPIVEFNNWGDKFWGVVINPNTGEILGGQNQLGILLGEIRLILDPTLTLDPPDAPLSQQLTLL